MKTIIVTGSVGTGKTTIAKSISNKLNYKYLDVNKLITRFKLSEGYDRKRSSKIIDIKKLNNHLIKVINSSKNEKGIIIDSHLSHYLPKKYVDLCIVTKCNLKILEKRLKKRKYIKRKIRENLDAEIFDICLEEARQKKHKINVINTSNKVNIIETIKKLNLK